MHTRVFLVGCSRSGTTVVQRCLGAHPQLISFPETDFLGKLVGGWNGRLQARFDRVRPARRQAAFRRLAEVLQRPEIEREGDVRRGFRASVRTLVRILDQVADERGVDGWVEKTPKHFRYLGLLQDVVADTRFVHVVRDGRDVVASLVNRARTHARFGNRLEPLAAARLWNEAIRASVRYQDKPEHLVISYEDFVHDTETESRHLCDFLRLQYDPEMLQVSGIENIVERNETWKSGAARPVAPQRSRFTELLTESDQRRVLKALDWRLYRQLFPHGVGLEKTR